MTVRTRFAPSPTGLLHVGGVRTALYSWLYAKHYNGDFVLRVEDTDQERSTQESVDAILDGMQWLGLNWEEGPVYQTDRYDRYSEVLNELLVKGLAYRCICSRERLDSLREKQQQQKQKPRYDGCCRDKNYNESEEQFVIRFKNPQEGAVVINDQVYGDIVINNSELDDLILCRTDGNPTYNFTVVVDDWDMKITHVIRGDDHINNTPRQINLLNALGASIPVYAHLPMILGDDGKRLSKRHGAVSVLEFRKQGILPQALLNYLVRLGWSHGDQEIFSMEEMVKLFDLPAVSKGVSSFNYEKLYWLNQHYMRESSFSDIEQEVRWHFKQQEIELLNGPDLEYLLSIQAERCQSLVELVEKSLCYYRDEIDYDPAAVKKQLRPVVLDPMVSIKEKFSSLVLWQADELNKIIHKTADEFELKMGKIAQPLRVAVTGSSMSPAIDDTLLLVGKERVLARIDKAIEMITLRKLESA